MRFFYDWFLAFRDSNAFYREGPGINYPLLGVLFVCGPAWLVEQLGSISLDYEGFRAVLKLSLVGTEVGLIFAFAALGRSVASLRPRVLALALYLLPATWAGGAWFGQIDVLGTCLLLVAFLGMGSFVKAAENGRLHLAGLAIGLLATVGAVLCKQLTLFSLPAIGLLWIFGMRRLSFLGRVQAFALTLLSALLVLLPDLFVVLPEGWNSHLLFVWLGGGSAHGEALSGNGANLWALLDFAPGTTASVPVLWGLSAKVVGLGLFFLVSFLALYFWLRGLGRGRDPLRESLLLAGLFNLAMATLLTGVHERYLVHGVPLLLLALETRGWAFFADGLWGRLGRFAWVVCAWSGMYVLASIHWEAFAGMLRPFRSAALLGWMELGLLVALMIGLGIEHRQSAKRETS